MKAHQLREGDKFVVAWMEAVMTAVSFCKDRIEAKDDDGQTLFIWEGESVWTVESHPYAF